MRELLGLNLCECEMKLKAKGLTYCVSETSGYRDDADRDPHEETRVIGIRHNKTEVLLITARF